MQDHNHNDDRRDLLGHAAALSRRGSGREENQDSYSVEDHIWILADGMGGHEGGRTASAVAVASAALATQPGDSDPVDAVESCHYHVFVVGELTEQPTMGSTIVLAVRDPESGAVRIAWCGDSRAYLWVDGALSRLTTDHNLAQEEVAAGRITADEAFDHPGQSILLSALGCGSSEMPEIGQVEIQGTGRLLLCSDGLTSGLRDEQIAELLDGADLEDVTLRLVDAAVAAGSSDDTSVVVVDLDRDVMSDFAIPSDEERDELLSAAVRAFGGRPIGQEDLSLNAASSTEQPQRAALEEERLMHSSTGTVAGSTDKGSVRSRNEDAFWIGDDIWIIADGMGGCPSGDMASRQAVHSVARVLDVEDRSEWDLLEAVLTAHADIERSAERWSAHAGMGTTLVAACRLDGGDLGVVHVGDSRAYLLTDGSLTRLTTDDNVAGELVALGELTEAQARHDPGQSILTKALGLGQDTAPFPTIQVLPQATGRLLLCTDGLTGELDDDEIKRFLATGSPEAACESLTLMALVHGGHDNITVVVVDL